MTSNASARVASRESPTGPVDLEVRHFVAGRDVDGADGVRARARAAEPAGRRLPDVVAGVGGPDVGHDETARVRGEPHGAGARERRDGARSSPGRDVDELHLVLGWVRVLAMPGANGHRPPVGRDRHGGRLVERDLARHREGAGVQDDDV
jgi:hypothetical protein